MCLFMYFFTIFFFSIEALAAPETLPNKPPDMKVLQNLPDKEEALKEVQKGETMIDIRRDAIKEAALSYGARGGLAMRTYEIRQELERRTRHLDRIFDFRQLLIPAPSGLLIEPPVVREGLDNLMIENNGREAAVTDKFLQISRNARIVAAPRSWRQYLERNWGDVEPPPDVLYPENDEERNLYNEYIEKGWQEGLRQAEDIFQDDLNLLVSDFVGMVRYKSLLAQNMISRPFALQVNKGVTGGGVEMRIGDRSVNLTGMPELIPGYNSWQPANR